jgi:hypothetical protein
MVMSSTRDAALTDLWGDRPWMTRRGSVGWRRMDFDRKHQSGRPGVDRRGRRRSQCFEQHVASSDHDLSERTDLDLETCTAKLLHGSVDMRWEALPFDEWVDRELRSQQDVAKHGA